MADPLDESINEKNRQFMNDLLSFKPIIHSIIRNRRISGKRDMVEYQFSIVNNIPLLTHLGHAVLEG